MCTHSANWENKGSFTKGLDFKEELRFFYVALMIKLALGSNKVLRCMHICISKGRL